jgi:hypothetical protein
MPNSNPNTPSATFSRCLRVPRVFGLLLVAATVGNCSSSQEAVNRSDSGVAGSGGTSATGGMSVPGGTTTIGATTSTGGNVVTAGVTTTGGASASAGNMKLDAGPASSAGTVTGGATGSGGLGQTGGTISSGGATSTGGVTINRDAGNTDGPPNADVGGTAGALNSGGNTGTAPLTGGNTSTGGTTSSGGTTGPGGGTRIGGTTSSGGTAGMGGTTRTGGATGGATNTGGVAGSGGGSIAGCTAVPVVPNATQQTRNVLCYLHSIYGNGILSGQEEDNNDNGMNAVFAATGKYPAIRAFDVNNSQAPTQCVAHWNAGGICMFGYHMGINGGTYNTKTNIANVLTAGTAENTSFNADLDRIAQFVQPLKTAGGVAILRLFHEAGAGCAWFWWGMGTSAQWQSLFKYAFNYLTATKGLNNVLFLAPLCQHPTSDYNPGAQYIDFGGADNYVAAGDTQPMTSMFQQAQTAFPNMMVALHECGTIPDPDQLKSTGTKWLLFNVWANPYFNSPYNTTAHLQAVYSNPYVITRDKLPSFK